MVIGGSQAPHRAPRPTVRHRLLVAHEIEQHDPTGVDGRYTCDWRAVVERRSSRNVLGGQHDRVANVDERTITPDEKITRPEPIKVARGQSDNDTIGFGSTLGMPKLATESL